MMIRPILFAAGTVLLVAAPVTAAAPCKDARGKFVKCPQKPAAAQRCKLNGKFAKCGTPGAKPM